MAFKNNYNFVPAIRNAGIAEALTKALPCAPISACPAVKTGLGGFLNIIGLDFRGEGPSKPCVIIRNTLRLFSVISWVSMANGTVLNEYRR